MQQPNGGKAPFIAPKLQIYGRARDITRAIGLFGSADFGPVGAIKTKLI